MLRIEWLEGDAQGCIDLLPDWSIQPAHDSVLVHSGTTPRRAAYLGKCSIRPGPGWVDFDYETFAAFNRAHTVFVGLMRVILDDGLPSEILWRNQGEESLRKMDVRLTYAPGHVAEHPPYAEGQGKDVMQLQAARVGQGDFRRKLLLRFNGCCALTGLGIDAVLRASHIKPWHTSTPEERLDINNGFLLASHVDALFDRYLISFDNDGEILWSETVTEFDRERLALPSRLLARLAHEQKAYLDEHRKLLRA